MRINRRHVLIALAAWVGLPVFRGHAQASSAQRYICTYNECDPYIYDPLRGDPDNVAGDHSIPAGTAFEDLPKGWLCPICASPISYFEKTDERAV